MRTALLLFLLSIRAVAQPTDALRAEQWIRSLRIDSPHGLAWPVAAGDSVRQPELYSGSSGVVLFYLELYHVTKEPRYLEEAKRGADWLIYSAERRKPTLDQVGFYTGDAGIAYTLERVYQITHLEKYRVAAFQLTQRLLQIPSITESSIDWRYNDVVYGAAGIGLFLLDYSSYPNARALAVKTGRGLLAHGLPADGGVRWYMDSSMMRQGYYMPNFSHGTAGVAYFLARLYQETGDKEFLTSALSAAAHLEKISNQNAWVYHHDTPDGKDLFYLSWCHGPAGTVRLYYLLYSITKDVAWLRKMEKSVSALASCGIPSSRSAGYWNNTGPCCGSAGIAAFFLEISRLKEFRNYRAIANTMRDDVISRATADGGALYWVSAEHRRRPDFVQAQTGYMQGASGIGLVLLRFYEEAHSIKPFVRLPDNPF